MANSTVAVSTQFGWIDYSAFGLIVALSTVVGSLIGVCGKQDTKVDYLLGGRSMKVLPIAVSLVFSQISGISLIGIPTEIYVHGTQYYAVIISIAIATVINCYVYLPVFYNLKLTSIFEYLELRFNRHTRFLLSLLYNVTQLLYIPLVIYVPGLIFNQVSGINLHLVTVVVSMTCIFYTMLGGIKAVVWTDFLQSFVTVGSTLVVIVIGVAHVGGIDVVLSRSYEGQRLEFFNFDPSPLSRSTFWTVSVGMTFAWLFGMAANQGMVQKVITLPDLPSARRAVVWSFVGNTFIKTVTVIVGLTIYATYYNCDPLYTKKISKADQAVPYFVMETAGFVPGLPGLFIAGIFSAALSTMSSHLNCLSATIYEDFVLPCVRKQKNMESKAHVVLKIIVVIFGVLCILMVYIIEHLGEIFDISMNTGGITTGTFFGIYTLGMVFPWANGKGAMAGTISSIAFMSWIVFGAGKAAAEGLLKHPYLPMTDEGCSDYNKSLATPVAVSSGRPPVEDNVFVLYRISYMLYPMIGTIVVIVVGIFVSWITGFNDPRQVDSSLIAPFMRKFARSSVNPHEEEKLNENKPPNEC